VRVERGASQVLFGLLPGQTADLDGRIWRVAHWLDPVPLALDQDSVRASLLGAVAPWSASGNDDGVEGELRARNQVEVVALNMDRGVLVETFPEQWRCKSAAGSRNVGATAARAAALYTLRCSSSPTTPVVPRARR
jgi:hypothetical protein